MHIKYINLTYKIDKCVIQDSYPIWMKIWGIRNFAVLLVNTTMEIAILEEQCGAWIKILTSCSALTLQLQSVDSTAHNNKR
jgi:hypothetical protein